MPAPSRWWTASAETIELERSRWQRVGQVGHLQLHPAVRGAPRPERGGGRLEHGGALVDPDRNGPGVTRQNRRQRHAGARPEVQDAGHIDPVGGGGHCLLKTLVGRHLFPHEVQVAGGVEMELAH